MTIIPRSRLEVLLRSFSVRVVMSKALVPNFG